MLHFDTRGLRDKLEVKIQVKNTSDYTVIVQRITNDPTFIPQYKFSRLHQRTISDTYFDSAGQHLFQAGQYLRLRREDGKRELVFRRLTQDVKFGEIPQEEIVIKSTAEQFTRSWELMRSRLSEATGNPIEGEPSDFDTIETFLTSIGFVPALDISIIRQPWIVEHIDSSPRNKSAPDHVAKLKYDRITSRRPDHQGGILHSVEFEATGVEAESASPQELRIPAYDAFVSQFIYACTQLVPDGNVVRRISAKYFEGMVQLGIAQSRPPWLDDRLAFRVSILRDTAEDPTLSSDLNAVDQQSRRRQMIDTADDLQKMMTWLSGSLAGWSRSASPSEAALPYDLVTSLESRLRGLESIMASLRSSVNVSVYQNQASVTQVSSQFDLSALSHELAAMIVQINRSADSEERSEQIKFIEEAREAAQRNDESAVRRNLAKVAKYVADLSRQIGAPVATAFIEAKFGIK